LVTGDRSVCRLLKQTTVFYTSLSENGISFHLYITRALVNFWATLAPGATQRRLQSWIPTTNRSSAQYGLDCRAWLLATKRCLFSQIDLKRVGSDHLEGSRRFLQVLTRLEYTFAVPLASITRISIVGIAKPTEHPEF
jgi:hypothetical protein